MPVPRSYRAGMSWHRVVLCLAGLMVLVVGLFVGLWPRGSCGSPFLPALDPSGGGCAPLLASPRLLAVVLLGLGLVVAVGALAWGSRARAGAPV